MSSLSAWIGILCEDWRHEWFLRRYLYRLGFRAHHIFPKTAPRGKGSGAAFVIREFPIEVQSIRRRLRSGRLLIAIIDADTGTTAMRRRELVETLKPSKRFEDDDPVALIIPKRSIETWILCLTGVSVSEADDWSNDTRVGSDRIRNAAQALFEALRQDQLPADWPASLRDAASEFQRIERFLRADRS